MKRLLRSWVFWVFVALPLAATLTLLTYQERNHYVCAGCRATVTRTQWRVGVWMSASLPLSPVSESVPGSTGHAHTWRFRQGSPYYFLGTVWGGCAIGGD